MDLFYVNLLIYIKKVDVLFMLLLILMYFLFILCDIVLTAAS